MRVKGKCGISLIQSHLVTSVGPGSVVIPVIGRKSEGPINRHSVWRIKAWSGWRVKLDFDRFRNIRPSDYQYITVIPIELPAAIFDPPN